MTLLCVHFIIKLWLKQTFKKIYIQYKLITLLSVFLSDNKRLVNNNNSISSDTPPPVPPPRQAKPQRLPNQSCSMHL